MRSRLLTPALLLLVVAGCGPVPAAAPSVAADPAPPVVAVTTQRVPLRQPGACTGAFVAHELDHTTTVPGPTVDMFEANGAGLALGDLDGDGATDVVLANGAGPGTILWNQGGLQFRTERLAASGPARAVNAVDVDGDERLDLVWTTGVAGPSYWHNTGDPGARWEPRVLEGVARPAYSMAWGDLDGDGDLDLVTGSYDAELLNARRGTFLLGDGAGVYLYEQRGGRWYPTQLAPKAQALAIALVDVAGDASPEIVVGNDFATPDMAWQRQGAAWAAIAPFRQTSHSTMSLDWADVENDGAAELFGTDMKPYDESVATLARWRPVMAQMWSPPLPNDRQIMENTLQKRQPDGTYRNQAYARGADATGWSWSGKFGDLDNDGFVDLYVVNGMAESDLLAYLPNHQLVEQNQALRNDGRGRFVAAPGWGLGSERGGRGMSMADLDGDGDLDVVVNNLSSPAQLFENRICGGASLQVELRWPGSGNPFGLGASVALDTSGGWLTRDVRAGSGYLSGDDPRLDFGLASSATLRRLRVRWPDGAESVVDAPEAGMVMRITRSIAAVQRQR